MSWRHSSATVTLMFSRIKWILLNKTLTGRGVLWWWGYQGMTYSMSALFWSQLPQTDTPHCVKGGGGVGMPGRAGKKEDETKNKNKNHGTLLLLFAIWSNPQQNN